MAIAMHGDIFGGTIYFAVDDTCPNWPYFFMHSSRLEGCDICIGIFRSYPSIVVAFGFEWHYMLSC